MDRHERTPLHIQVPPRKILNTGDQHQIQPTLDAFFSSTRRAIESYYQVRESSPFEIRSGELALPGQTVSDDRCTVLTYRDKTVAVVLERRTQFNTIEYTFFSNLDGLE